MKTNPLERTMKLNPTVACFLLKSAWQAFSLRSALITLLLAPLVATDYAWDGHVLWLNVTLRGETTLWLTFAE